MHDRERAGERPYIPERIARYLADLIPCVLEPPFEAVGHLVACAIAAHKHIRDWDRDHLGFDRRAAHALRVVDRAAVGRAVDRHRRHCYFTADRMLRTADSTAA